MPTISALDVPILPYPGTPDKVFGVPEYVHNLSDEEYAWVAKHNYTVDTDFNAWFDMYAEDAWLQFGNSPRIFGREAIRAHFLPILTGVSQYLRHNVVRDVSVPSLGLIFQESIAHTVVPNDPENKVIAVPVIGVMHRKPGEKLMRGHQLYIDMTEVIARAQSVAKE
ncbi:hypothetical protein C8J56DRAFT_286990 [Mycena floridula]|nr:hypothetical protein C8J56DRAFT_286990 [Mycena floridula]